MSFRSSLISVGALGFGLGLTSVARADDEPPPRTDEPEEPSEEKTEKEKTAKEKPAAAKREEAAAQLFAPGVAAFMEGRFDAAADLFAKLESPTELTETKTQIAVELRRIAAHFTLQGIVLVSSVTHPDVARFKSRYVPVRSYTNVYDAAVPPYDLAVEQLVNGDVESAEQTLQALETSGRDPIELGVTRVLHAVARTWLARHIVPVAHPASHANGIIPKSERGSWYGWQIIAIDSLLLSSVVTVSALNKQLSAGVIQGVSIGAGVLMLAAPSWVHVAHARNRAAVFSLASRSLFPITGALGGAAVMIPVWYALGADSSQYLPLAGAALGAGVGLIAAMVFDSVALAYRPKELPTAHPPGSSSPTTTTSSYRTQLQPFAIPTANANTNAASNMGVLAGVAGSF